MPFRINSSINIAAIMAQVSNGLYIVSYSFSLFRLQSKPASEGGAIFFDGKIR